MFALVTVIMAVLALWLWVGAAPLGIFPAALAFMLLGAAAGGVMGVCASAPGTGAPGANLPCLAITALAAVAGAAGGLWLARLALLPAAQWRAVAEVAPPAPAAYIEPYRREAAACKGAAPAPTPQRRAA